MSTRNIDPNIPLLTTVLLAIDAYVFYALSHGMKNLPRKNLLGLIYIIGMAFGYVGFYFLVQNFTIHPLESTYFRNFFIGFFFAFLVFKVVLVSFFLLEDTIRTSILFIRQSLKAFRKSPQKVKLYSRRKFVRQIGLTAAAIPFTSMIYGVAKGKYNFKVRNLNMTFNNLPKSFNGFKIVQISDIHSGSFDDIYAIREAIDLINDQNPDVVLFTGDLVNYDAREIKPFVEEFKRLKPKVGTYSVLGNHDYGDYKSWNTEQEKSDNNELLKEFHKEMNFNLLNNEAVILYQGNDKISIVGVENWGKPPFPQNGDLDMAVLGVEDVPFKVLMSHDPTHWNKKVIDHPTHFDLTLSGHTHGMQFGVEIPGFKWSPVKYLYPEWAGLYEKKNQFLYVNRGFGYIGFPGRVGILPEITLINLQSPLA
ncbi:metallophosphoesterase [Namhaeicola litoreus]|uniref:Metallophosphoesterase n=1 Tax=Namhaeicola litoreus TaxID=1052145 RepID=A0ABW3Y4Z1_9FLAO